MDGLEEDEWELHKLEHAKQLNEEDIQKETFRIADWDLTQAKSIYARQAEAVQAQLEIERRRLVEAEQRKQSEYLRLLTEQQASLDAVKMPPKGEKTQAMWERLWSATELPSPWTREEDFILCFLVEALVQGMRQAVITPTATITLPDNVGAAVAVVFQRLNRTVADGQYARSGDACQVRPCAGSRGVSGVA